MAVEAGKIAAGGLIGCGLAILILWWAVGADPFGVAPPVGRLAPWLVPAKFRVTRPPLEDPLSEPETLPFQAPDAEPAASIAPPPARFAAPQTIEPAPSAAPDASEGDPPGESPAPEDAPGGFGAADHDAGRVAAAAYTMVGVRNAPVRSSDDLKRALQTARRLGDAFARTRDEPLETRTRLAGELFQAIARLGDVVTFVSPEDLRTRTYIEQLHSLLLDIMALPDSGELLGAESIAWLALQRRAHRGAMLLGVVRDIQPAGALFETRLQLAEAADSQASVMSRIDPSDFYAPGQRVLMLGVIVDRPQENLAGYVGGQSWVVMGGFPLPLP